MVSQRELRYYTSIPKIMFVFLASAGFTAIGWQMLATGANIIMSWLVLGFFGLCTLVALAWFLLTVVFRKPILTVNDTGIAYSQPLQPWRSVFAPWADVARIGISAQYMGHTTNYYFVVGARRPERYTATRSRLARLSVSMYPALTDVVITVMLGWLFLRATRRRRTQVLERIKTTFAPEIIQYGVWLDEREQPM